MNTGIIATTYVTRFNTAKYESYRYSCR